MRVVAGTARGRTLQAPPGKNTRPTSDRVRESIFNSLNSLDLIADAAVLDLFAGSGALGIEALSRGAATVTFVESDRAAARTIADNIERCGFADRSQVSTVTAERFLTTRSSRDSFDLALVDPPYAFDAWLELMAALPARAVVIESDRTVAVPPEWHVLRERSYGGTVVQFATRDHPESARDLQEQMR